MILYSKKKCKIETSLSPGSPGLIACVVNPPLTITAKKTPLPLRKKNKAQEPCITSLNPTYYGVFYCLLNIIKAETAHCNGQRKPRQRQGFSAAHWAWCCCLRPRWLSNMSWMWREKLETDCMSSSGNGCFGSPSQLIDPTGSSRVRGLFDWESLAPSAVRCPSRLRSQALLIDHSKFQRSCWSRIGFELS